MNSDVKQLREEVPSATGANGATGTPSRDPADVPSGVIFEMLTSDRRRWTLRHLKRTDGTTTLGELAEHIAARENDKEVREITSQERKRVYVALYQCHLPKLNDHGFVAFDKDRGTVALGPAGGCVDQYLDLVDVSQPRSFERVAVLVAGWAGLLVTAVSGLGPVVGLAVALCLTIGGVAGYHLRRYLRAWQSA